MKIVIMSANQEFPGPAWHGVVRRGDSIVKLAPASWGATPPPSTYQVPGYGWVNEVTACAATLEDVRGALEDAAWDSEKQCLRCGANLEACECPEGPDPSGSGVDASQYLWEDTAADAYVGEQTRSRGEVGRAAGGRRTCRT